MTLRPARSPLRHAIAGGVIEPWLMVQVFATTPRSRFDLRQSNSVRRWFTKAFWLNCHGVTLEPGGHDRTEIAPRHLFGSGFGRRSCRRRAVVRRRGEPTPLQTFVPPKNRGEKLLPHVTDHGTAEMCREAEIERDRRDTRCSDRRLEWTID